MAVDPGTVRCGIAVCDWLGLLATPVGVIRVKDGRELPAAIAARAVELEAGLIIIGYPVSMDGTVGPRALAAERLAQQVRAHTELEVRLFDERLTSVEAEDLLKEAGRTLKQSKEMRDAAAAAVLLTWWLEKNPQGTLAPAGESEETC
ncbi:MAG TPA: Holliday junction resolvase RuvX [Myxococcota bacterium]|nr:Holliday junction resolvase RuvX [Myxococcota bacterium]HOD07929.1 Holliday junction resolvase RuvX [Myxococcota bacterium]HPB50113.1 Holliday junction resolvase RuvX [Myxococcota bacterium]HQP95180.1 Holliday junction resolvase RuvX [Myxococcota bacterium]